MSGPANRLTGRRILVVGASAGVGRAFATSAAGAGAAVVFAARRRGALDEAVRGAGRGSAVLMDVRDSGSVERGFEDARAALDGIDVVLFAPGMAVLAELDEHAEEDWTQVLDSNVVGAARVLERSVAVMDDDGLVVVLSSIAAERARPGLVSYSASKAALDHLLEGWRVEHPRRRLVRAVLGDTADTELADDFDAGRFTDLGRRWALEGHLYARQMPLADLADALVEVVALACSHPELAITDVRVEPRGGRMLLG